jgi:hypothetical protein
MKFSCPPRRKSEIKCGVTFTLTHNQMKHFYSLSLPILRGWMVWGWGCRPAPTSTERRVKWAGGIYRGKGAWAWCWPPTAFYPRGCEWVGTILPPPLCAPIDMSRSDLYLDPHYSISVWYLFMHKMTNNTCASFGVTCYIINNNGHEVNLNEVTINRKLNKYLHLKFLGRSFAFFREQHRKCLETVWFHRESQYSLIPGGIYRGSEQ